MWPAEGSVSEEAVKLFAEEGIRWIATDEAILAHSLEYGEELFTAVGLIVKGQ